MIFCCRCNVRFEDEIMAYFPTSRPRNSYIGVYAWMSYVRIILFFAVCVSFFVSCVKTGHGLEPSRYHAASLS
jgi:hypothetical protein